MQASIATLDDLDGILCLLLEEFIFQEPITAALDTKPEEIREHFESLVTESVSSGTTVVIKDENGQVVAVRMSQYLERPKLGEEKTLEPDENSGPPSKSDLIHGLLDELGEHKWDFIPADVDKLLYIIIICVRTSHYRKGLGRILLGHGLEEIRHNGTQGIIAEATALNSQRLFAKLGYDVLNVVKHEHHLDSDGRRIFNCTDGTDCAQLVFKRLDSSGINIVTWDREYSLMRCISNTSTL